YCPEARDHRCWISAPITCSQGRLVVPRTCPGPCPADSCGAHRTAAAFPAAIWEREPASMNVRDGMTKIILSIGPAHTLREASRLMAAQHVGAAVVTDRAAPVWPGLSAQIGEGAPGLLHNDLQCGQIPERHIGFGGDVNRPLGNQDMRPEVPVGSRPPDSSGEAEEFRQAGAVRPGGQA